MPNQRISEFKEKTALFGGAIEGRMFLNGNENRSTDSNILLMSAQEKVSNNKITFFNFKKSLLRESMLNAGEQKIIGKKIFHEECSLKTLPNFYVENLYTDKYINQEEDGSAEGFFEDGKILFNSKEKFSFGENIFFSKEGCLNLNTSRNEGSINTSGNTYIDKIYSKYKKVIHKQNLDENVRFHLKINQGITEQTVFLPKTFKNKPVIQVNLVSSQNNTFQKYNISNVNEKSFDIKFDQQTDSEDYQLHVSAFSPTFFLSGEVNFKSQKKNIQRFHTSISAPSQTETINFREAFNSKPIISIEVESADNPNLYSISDISEESFKINFERPPEGEYIIHTISK